MKQQQDHLAKKVAIPTSASGLTDAQKQLVDELAEAKAAVDAIKPIADHMEKLRKECRDLADLHHMPHEQAVLQGHKHSVIFSPQCEMRVIEDINGIIGLLKDKVGYDGLLSMLKLGLADIDKHLTPIESKPYIKTVMGTRTFKGYT